MNKNFHNLSFISLFKRATDKEFLLFFAALLAMLISNSDMSIHYYEVLNSHITLSYNSNVLSMSLIDWINDLLMALFFLIVGIEIKKEMLSGHLSTWKQRSLPIVAAIGGVALPGIIYLICNKSDPIALEGWAIPAATDIAFTIGALSVFGKRVPVSIKVFVTALAIIDDLIAVLIIALFYSKSLDADYLVYSLASVLALIICNRLKVRQVEIYLLFGALLWGTMLFSGIHATVAGVIFGLTLPVNEENDIAGKINKALSDLVSYLIMPLFAFANSGVTMQDTQAGLLNPVTIGIFTGLFLGKQLGIFFSAKLAISLGIAQMPEKGTTRQLYAASVLCGIGFTMSLFIGLLAFGDNSDLLNQAKIGIFAGSITSLVVGSLLLKFTRAS